ncbi:FecCD family ABC transporter permease [Desulfoluna spongiiphila]|uniref:FecCD family ABC transporter permease n=1 Tax=Desulfoluna spongiiphila TaxID=419481 RepID=UPI001255F33C|nr:iron ABC transporter permease [Desulfoluna spongiiphila]VVS95648.1 abc transporter permease protein btuc-like [Desulfoluna spongiiphila]
MSDTSRVQGRLFRRILSITALLSLILGAAVVLGLATGPSGIDLHPVVQLLTGSLDADSLQLAIIERIRLPRVLMALFCGAVLSLGGLVFQALLGNPLAEPYILGISGGAATGAIMGILAGFARVPGVSLTAFAGSMTTLFLVLLLARGESRVGRDAMLLSGVMVNAFCSAVIMFLISISEENKLHDIMFWLMGDLSSADMSQVGLVALLVLPCFVVIFLLSHKMNLMLMGREMARAMGVSIRRTTLVLLVATSFMVSAMVCQSGLMGFVGLVVPHILRQVFGTDHRVLVPATIVGGGAFMVVCDLLARWIPREGEIPVGVITAILGAPLFIMLLKRRGRS